jgi:hypothetical protein
VFEEIVPHKVVIRFGVITRQIDVFIHVERLDVSERNSTLFVVFDQFSVHAERCTSYNNYNSIKRKKYKFF